MRLNGKFALVTGAGSEFGAANAKGFLRACAKVVFAGNHEVATFDIDPNPAMTFETVFRRRNVRKYVGRVLIVFV